MIRLSVTSSAGRSTFESDRTEILVGNRDGADLRIQEPGVARNHCLLRIENGALTLVDLGSPDGVLFAGQAVRQARMQVGSAFRLGDVLIEIEEIGAGAPAVAAPRVVPAAAPKAAAPPAATPKAAPTKPAASAPPRRTASDPRGRAPAPPSQPAAPIPHGTSDDFARELREALSKAPWYAISAVLHALILFVLWQIPYDPRVPETQIGMQAVLPDAQGEQADSTDDEEPNLDELEDDQPEEDWEDIEENVEKREEMPAPMESLEEKPVKIGIATPNYRINQTKLKGKSLENGDATIDRGNVQGEQQKAKSAIEKGNGRGLQRLRGISARSIVVIKGEFDEMETVLSLYKIPHISIERGHLISYKLDKARVLCINCGRSPTSLQKGILVKKIKKFAERGGWVITSDWALAPYLTEAFPGYISEIVPRKRQVDTTVEVEERGTTSPLLRDVFSRRTKPRWWLEEASKFVGTKGARVKTLVYSTEMKKRYGSGAVVVEFRPRRGRVVHLMGHFYQKDGNHAGVVGMHRLIFNFLQERFPVARGGDPK